jgi:hypothetical protein
MNRRALAALTAVVGVLVVGCLRAFPAYARPSGAVNGWADDGVRYVLDGYIVTGPATLPALSTGDAVVVEGQDEDGNPLGPMGSASVVAAYTALGFGSLVTAGPLTVPAGQTFTVRFQDSGPASADPSGYAWVTSNPPDGNTDGFDPWALDLASYVVAGDPPSEGESLIGSAMDDLTTVLIPAIAALIGISVLFWLAVRWFRRATLESDDAYWMSDDEWDAR